MIKSVKAESLIERGSIEKHGLFTKEKILERGGSWGEAKEFIAKWGEIGDVLSNGISWINYLPDNMPLYTVQLLAKVYELLTSTVLYTPLFLFNNTFVKDTSLVFAGISILIVTILTMIEGIKKMLKQRNTDITKIVKRYFLAIMGAGFAPFLFEKAFELINKLSKSITQIGSYEITNFKSFTQETGAFGLVGSGFIETLCLLLFDIVVIALLIPIILQTGRRWWDLMCLSSITPLALTTWIFDDHRHYFNKWWSNIKRLSQTQLIYAIYICLMGVFIFGTANVVSGGGLIVKLLVIIGGLARMSNVPHFIKSRVDNGNDIEDSGLNIYKSFKDVYDTVTFKNLKTFKYLKSDKSDKLKNFIKKRSQRNTK